MKIKILYINHNANNGGSEQSLYDILSNLDRERFEPYLAVPEQGSLLKKASDIGIPCFIVSQLSWRWFYPGFLNKLKFVVLLPYYCWVLIRWYFFLTTNKFDLVHVNINRVIEPLWAIKATLLPLVVHFRDIPTKIKRPFLGGKNFFYRTMNLADHWIANSTATYDDILPEAKKPVSIIHNFINIKKFDCLASQDCNFSFPTEKHIKVVMIAALVVWKNHRDFIEIARLVCQKRSDVYFYLVGKGYMQETLFNQAKSLGIDKKVIFTGYIGNVSSFLKQVDVLMHTVAGEPFGRIFIEAMAARKPVIAYRYGGASEIVEHEKTGFLVEDYNTKQAARHLEKLLDDPGLREKMGIAGRKRLEENFTEKIVMPKIEALYLSLIKKKSKANNQ